MARAKIVTLPRGKRIPQFWSLSRYNVWRECAHQYMLKHILKYPTPTVPAMERGTKIHKLLEGMLKGTVTGMPKDLEKLSTEIRNLKKLRTTPESEWTLTKDFEQTYATDWDGAWLRAKIDMHHYFQSENNLWIADLKTGRFKVTQAQMDLYAAMSPYYYPDVRDIDVELWFSDQGEIHAEHYTRKQADGLMRKWKKRADVMLADKKFLPSPGFHCRRCPFRSDKEQPNGKEGPCHAWKKLKTIT